MPEGGYLLITTMAVRDGNYCGAASPEFLYIVLGLVIPVNAVPGQYATCSRLTGYRGAHHPIYIYSYAEFDVAIMTSVTRNGNSGVIIGAETIGERPSLLTGLVMSWSCCLRRLITKDYWFQTRLTLPPYPTKAALMTCAYSGRITVNGSAPLPVSGIPFGKWDNPNVSVGFDGTSIIVRDISYTGRDDVAGTATIDPVIFNQTAPVGGDGITMTNAAGQGDILHAETSICI